MKKIYFILLLGICLGSKTITAQFFKLLDFNSTINGAEPHGNLTISGNSLYGMTHRGGANDLGCIFRINTDGSGYIKLLDFNGTQNGSEPYGTLLLLGEELYGMAFQGGANDLGCIFKINTDGSGYKKLLDFDGIENGGQPFGSLNISGDVLYGMANFGAHLKGCIFRINIDGSEYIKLFDFSGEADGANPLYGALAISGGKLYGTTTEGGIYNYGCIFRINTNGTGYDKLFDFSGLGSSWTIWNQLKLFDNVLYGMTSHGGAINMGCIFRINTDGDGYISLLDFDCGTLGCMPTGSLTLLGNKIYGMTTNGGENSYGCIFEYDLLLEKYLKLWDFNHDENGMNPHGDLIFSNGILYGMTTYGGSNEDGTIFKYILPPTLQTSNIDNPIKIYSDGSDIYVVISRDEGFSQLEVYNLSGMCITQMYNLVEGRNKITGEYISGVYIVRLKLNDRQHVKKVVIER